MKKYRLTWIENKIWVKWLGPPTSYEQCKLDIKTLYPNRSHDKIKIYDWEEVYKQCML